MLDVFGEGFLVVLVGFGGGLLLGLAARLGRFCTLGAIEDFHYGRSSTRLRMWGVALGTSIVAVFGATALGLFDPKVTAYIGAAPNLLAAAIGGLVFGVGMALSGNCGYGALARLGGGELRSFVIVLVMGLAAMATLSGPLAPLRVALFPQDIVAARPAGISYHLSEWLPVSPVLIGLVIGAAILGLSLWRAENMTVLWGLPVSLAIVSGYLGTTWVSSNSFEAVSIRSHTFSAPVGETLVYLMLASGIGPGFGVGSVFGVLVGAFIGSQARGRFRWEACDDSRELRRQIGGAVMMGIGAVVAVGCSIGQGLSAFSVLAVSAPVALGAIWLGGWLGLRFLIEGRFFGAVSLER